MGWFILLSFILHSLQKRYAKINEASQLLTNCESAFCAGIDNDPDFPDPECIRRHQSLHQEASFESAIHRCKRLARRIRGSAGGCARRQDRQDHLAAAVELSQRQARRSADDIDSTIDGRPATERIRQDSTAQQGSPSLLGNEMLLNISPGTALGQPVKDYDILPSSSSNTVNDFATSGTDLAQRLSKLSDQISLIVKDVQEGKGTVGRLFSDEALYNNLNATVRETEDVMRQIRSGEGSAGRFVNDPALYNNANEIALQLRQIAADLRAGRGTAGKLLTNDELYNRINRTADRLDHSVDQVNSMITEINAGHGTLGRLIKDEQIYNDARAAIARFNTTAERIDNVVAGCAKRRRNIREITHRRGAVFKRQPTLFRRCKANLRLPPKPEEVPDHQVPAVLKMLAHLLRARNS